MNHLEDWESGLYAWNPNSLGTDGETGFGVIKTNARRGGMIQFRRGADPSDDDCRRFAGRVIERAATTSRSGAAVYEPRLFSGARRRATVRWRRGSSEGLHPTRASRSKAWGSNEGVGSWPRGCGVQFLDPASNPHPALEVWDLDSGFDGVSSSPLGELGTIMR